MVLCVRVSLDQGCAERWAWRLVLGGREAWRSWGVYGVCEGLERVESEEEDCVCIQSRYCSRGRNESRLRITLSRPMTRLRL
jgi:hypothetical protein